MEAWGRAPSCSNLTSSVCSSPSDTLKPSLAAFILKLGHPLEFANRGDASEDPGEFGMTNNMRLNKLVTFIGIEPAGDVLGDALVDALAENGGFRWSGDGMEINDSKVAFVLFEHL